MDPLLVDALIKVESGGDDSAIGDKGIVNHAYGCLQIRQPVCDDVNRVFGGHLVAQAMLGNRQLSIDTFHKYMQIYATEKHIGRAPTDEDRARIWNGGPYGYLHPNTLGYWTHVQKWLANLAVGGA